MIFPNILSGFASLRELHLDVLCAVIIKTCMVRHMGQNLNRVHFSLRVSLRVQINIFSLKVVSLCTLWILQGS